MYLPGVYLVLSRCLPDIGVVWSGERLSGEGCEEQAKRM
jgi:hypothetical protein